VVAIREKLFRNWVTVAGTALAVVSLGNIFFFFLIDIVSSKPSPYTGIVAYMVLPAFLVCGLILIPLGLWWDRRRRLKMTAEEAAKLPTIDFNNPAQRTALFSFAAFAIVFLMLSAAGSYRAYEYTDSVEFCGQLCHSVMAPEHTAYQLSAHARVRCVDCHVGTGASWYVRSKLSGARQVLAVTFNTFPRPIPTPVHNLRPAQDTCEQCHWPKKFHGAQLRTFTHFSSDEKNTMREVSLLVKTGGGDPDTGATSGIHWHMNIGNEITYVASDEKHQVIPYIRVKDLQGRVMEYTAKDSPLSKEQIAKMEKRRMDCIDCHNRPTHVYVPPDQAVDQSLHIGKLNPSLPFIKQQAVAVLTADYKTTPDAMVGIATGIHDFYTAKYPDVEKNRTDEVRSTIAELQRIYRSSIFPEMKLDWRTHPNNIGHYYFNGCFRCHDGQHVAKDGHLLSKDCSTCHIILSQGEKTTQIDMVKGTEFKHPVDLGDLTAVNCSDCHTGGVSP
jgi:nitrate/TMAO reductase-like tetraheme cytochrome c subunit